MPAKIDQIDYVLPRKIPSVIETLSEVEMPNQNIWYVAHETYVGRKYARPRKVLNAKVTRRNSPKEALALGKAVLAGTLNPYKPKRFIPPEKVIDWINKGEPAR